MPRLTDTLILLAVFCASTALFFWLLSHLIHDGALSLGFYLDTRARGPVFRASAILMLVAISLSSGCVLIGTFRDFLQNRRTKRINKGRNA